MFRSELVRQGHGTRSFADGSGILPSCRFFLVQGFFVHHLRQFMLETLKPVISAEKVFTIIVAAASIAATGSRARCPGKESTLPKMAIATKVNIVMGTGRARAL